MAVSSLLISSFQYIYISWQLSTIMKIAGGGFWQDDSCNMKH